MAYESNLNKDVTKKKENLIGNTARFILHHIKRLTISGCPSVNDAHFDFLVKMVTLDFSRAKVRFPFVDAK